MLPKPPNAGALVAEVAPNAGVGVAPKPVLGLAPKMFVPDWVVVV